MHFISYNAAEMALETGMQGMEDSEMHPNRAFGGECPNA